MKSAFSLGLALLLFLMPSSSVLATSKGFSSQYEVQTSAGGAESKFSSSHQGFVRSQYADITSESGKEGEIDLTPLTFAYQQAHPEPTLFLSTVVTPLTETLQKTIITPVQSGIDKASQAFSISSSFVSQLMNIFNSIFVIPVETGIQVSSNFIHQISSFIEHSSSIFKNSLLALGVTSLGFGSLFLGKSYFNTTFKMGFEGITAISNLILHTGCLIVGGLTALVTGKTVRESYLQSLWSLQKVTGALGSPLQDLKIVKRNLIIGLVGVVSLVLIVTVAVPTVEAVIASATLASQSTTPDLAIRTQYSLAKTSQDCAMPMQCEDVLGLGVTLGSNFLLGFSPSTQALQGAGVVLMNGSTDDLIRRAGKGVQYADEAVEEISSVSKVLNHTDDVALTFTRSDLEERIGKEFVQEVFGNAQGKEFEEIAQKWPNALIYLSENENQGHVIVKHVAKEDSFIISRVIDQKYSEASTFNSSEEMLNVVESTLSDSKNKLKIKDWLNNPNLNFKTLELTYTGQNPIGRFYEKGASKVIEVNNALVVLKKEKNTYYILTSYATK